MSNTEAPETAEVTQAVEQQQPTLTINDLAALANIINVASQRGAFKADELSNVGSAYDKLNSFLKAAQAQTASAAPAESPEASA
jgi:hypothetical protein